MNISGVHQTLYILYKHVREEMDELRDSEI